MASVLLVDDHPDVREVVEQLLRLQGHHVHCCDTGEKALEQLVDLRPDAIVIDERLPGMSGMEVVRRIRQNQRLTGLFIVVCSADGSYDIPAREAGADDFWVKGSEGLFESIERLGDKLT